MSYQIKNIDTNEVTLETKQLHAAQDAVRNAYMNGGAAVILMHLENGKTLLLAKLSEVE